MDHTPTHIPDSEEDNPPILGSWLRVYFVILLFHALLLLLFTLFTQSFSPEG